MLVAVFLMVLIPCVIISFVGASIGLPLRNTILPKHLIDREWNQSAVAFVAIVFIANLAFQTNEKKSGENEEVAVINFVKGNKEVLLKAGHIKTVSIGTIGTKKGSSTKEYDVYVQGDKTVYPIVRVLRDASHPQIILACVTEISSGQRDPSKDPCKQ